MVIIDNGHGRNTSGKRSPKWSDGTQLFEWEFNRNIAKRIAGKLACLGIPYFMLVPEDHDVALSERCKRANAMYRLHPEAFLISIHGNAGGGTGYEVFTSVGDTPADPLATIFFEEMQKSVPQWKFRTDTTDGDVDKEAKFYILHNTSCPAILTENGFMDNEPDCRFMMSVEGRKAITQAHINAILRIKKIKR